MYEVASIDESSIRGEYIFYQLAKLYQVNLKILKGNSCRPRATGNTRWRRSTSNRPSSPGDWRPAVLATT